MLRSRAVSVTWILLLALSACTVWGESESDAVRRAVIAHELDERGVQVDDLIIRLSPGEFRADFGYATKIVWLVSPGYQRQYREGEYFKVRDPERSYLFVEDIAYGESHDQATVGVVLWLESGELTSKEITLRKEGNVWQIVSERMLEISENGR